MRWDDVIKWISAAVGAIAGAVGGAWTGALTCLLALNVVDYVSGLVCAALGRSTKTDGGRLSTHGGLHWPCAENVHLGADSGGDAGGQIRHRHGRKLSDGMCAVLCGERSAEHSRKLRADGAACPGVPAEAAGSAAE